MLPRSLQHDVHDIASNPTWVAFCKLGLADTLRIIHALFMTFFSPRDRAGTPEVALKEGARLRLALRLPRLPQGFGPARQ